MHRNFLIPPERISKIKSRFQDLDSEALLFLDINNIRYLTGFTGSDGALIIGERQQILLVDGRYTNQAKREVDGVEVFEYRDKIEGIETIISESGLKSVGFEPTIMNVNTYLKLK
jgi:Xaa-Pro aminopeptidase